jgi:hypothetical protein
MNVYVSTRSNYLLSNSSKWFLRMRSFGSIFGDDVKREYLRAQSFRLHFLLMIFEAGSLHTSNRILVLGYRVPLPHALIASAPVFFFFNFLI